MTHTTPWAPHLTHPQVVFLRSVPDNHKTLLLSACTAVLYTPQHEHFGIVPLEAMAWGKAVVACDSGGPKESVISGRTGLLCEPTPGAFADAMRQLMVRRLVCCVCSGATPHTDDFRTQGWRPRWDGRHVSTCCSILAGRRLARGCMMCFTVCWRRTLAVPPVDCNKGCPNRQPQHLFRDSWRLLPFCSYLVLHNLQSIVHAPDRGPRTSHAPHSEQFRTMTYNKRSKTVYAVAGRVVAQPASVPSVREKQCVQGRSKVERA